MNNQAPFLEAFNEDTFLQKSYNDLVLKHLPDVLLETGTYHGKTTQYLASFNLPVITTEINESFYRIAQNNLQQFKNVLMLLGDSPTLLTSNFHLIENKKVLAFLDSHWLNDKVLEKELTLLKKLSVPPIVLIHDFFVPNKDFGYDTYSDGRYDYVTYKSFFDELYGENRYDYSYNQEATGSRRGVIFLEPKN